MGFADGHVEPFQIAGVAELFSGQGETDWNSWAHWGAGTANGQEPGPGTVRYELTKVLELRR